MDANPLLHPLLMRLIPFLICLLLTLAPALAHADSCKGRPQNRVRADLVFDLATGKILIEDNADAVIHPASLTKLLSLSLVFDDLRARKIRYNQKVTLVRRKGETDNRTAKITRMTVREAVNGVATASLNNALDGLAALTGTQGKFVERMNDRARLWGMDKSFFVNPTGWPTDQSVQLQRTSVHDLARLLTSLWRDYEPEMKEFSGKPSVTIAGLPRPLDSTNHLLEGATGRLALPYKGAIGGKTGYTCYSGWHLITIYQDSETGRRMGAITAGHDTGRARDLHMKTLLDKARPKLAAFDASERRRIAREAAASRRAQQKTGAKGPAR